MIAFSLRKDKIFLIEKSGGFGMIKKPGWQQAMLLSRFFKRIVF